MFFKGAPKTESVLFAWADLAKDRQPRFIKVGPDRGSNFYPLMMTFWVNMFMNKKTK